MDLRRPSAKHVCTADRKRSATQETRTVAVPPVSVVRAVSPLDLLWLFFILSSLQPVFEKYQLALARRRALSRIASLRDATVITLIHRQETLSTGPAARRWRSWS